MKSLAVLMLCGLVTLSLLACASTQPTQVRVKCPACGYEFMAPASR